SDITTIIPERDIPQKPAKTRPHCPASYPISEHGHDYRDMLNNGDIQEHDSDMEDPHISLALSSSLDEDEDAFVDSFDSFSQDLEESDWSITPKFSCLPSPLSPRHTMPHNPSPSFRHTPHRHRYRHHGHSRHALLHLKWFWACREDLWMEHKARMFEAKAYDGLSIFSSVSPNLRLPGGYVPVPPHPSATPEPPPAPPTAQLPPLTIHPRRGDLSALHDPYSMHIDRYFVGMQLWTMSKTLWMFDVHMASGELTCEEPKARVVDDLFEEPLEEDSIETSDSNAFSDDSDSTLVESDNEQDSPRRDVSGSELSSETVNDPKSYPEQDRDSPPDTPCFGAASSQSKSSPAWATTWYHRWEVLLQLCVENKPKVEQSDLERPRALLSRSRPGRLQQRFFIGDEWDDDVPEEDEEEGEEEELKRNVLVVVNDECSNAKLLRHWF
ncbi:hypothetical protein H0H93_014037, partial [Arthromyces matolae]